MRRITLALTVVALVGLGVQTARAEHGSRQARGHSSIGRHAVHAHHSVGRYHGLYGRHSSYSRYSNRLGYGGSYHRQHHQYHGHHPVVVRPYRSPYSYGYRPGCNSGFGLQYHGRGFGISVGF